MKTESFHSESSRPKKAGNFHLPISKIGLWGHPIRTLLLFFILSVTLPLTGFAESVDTQIQKGISQYSEGAFKDAGESFSSARSARPEDSRIPYNQGNSLYKDGNFQEALKAYNDSASDETNPTIRKNSLYNTGNALVKLEKLEEAESAFKKVLTIDPSDIDAKYNLEYVREQLKKKEEQKQDQDKQKNEDSDKDSSSKKEQGEKQEPNNDKESQAKEPPPPAPPENKDSEKKEPETPAQAEASETQISEEEAEKMLERLTEDLKSISRMQAGKTKSTYQGNDW